MRNMTNIKFWSCVRLAPSFAFRQVTPIFVLIFLLVGLKEACMPNFSFLGSFFTASPDGRAAGGINKPTCAQVAVMTTVAHKKNKQHSFNAKVNFSRMLPYA